MIMYNQWYHTGCFSVTRNCFAILFLYILLFFPSLRGQEAISNVNDTIRIPDDKESCSCSWTPWMNSGLPTSSGEEDEKYAKLRKAGYEFCSSPVDIQCYNHELSSLEIGFGGLCDISIGFTCSLLCGDYSVRVACCYCPPEATGPEFQIFSRSHEGGCLAATTSGSGDESIGVESTCDLTDQAQSWVWVSRFSIMNVKTQQCLAMAGTTVMLDNCDLSSKKQRWKYIDRTKTLQAIVSSSYVYLTKVGPAVSLSSSRGLDSQWLAQVEEGTTSLKNMKSPPCVALPKPENGDMSCTLGQYLSSECKFSCSFGYRLPEDVVNPSKCTDDGLFTVDTPKCEKILCPSSAFSIDHGTATCSNQNFLDSSCLYKCDAGYALIGSNQLACTDAGEWTDALPSCERVVCEPDLEKDGSPNGAVNCTNGAYFGSKCTYTCKEGYSMVGSAIRSCQMDETWSPSKPVCNKIQCPAILAAENSRMSCTAGTDYLSTCKFSCDTGYTMVGSASSVCTADKTWGSEPPTCERKTCNALRAPQSGDMFCDDDYFYASKCSFTCSRGFEMEGEESLKCTDEGWNFGAPICKQIMCDHQANPVNGVVSCSNTEIYGSVCSFSCSNGFQLAGEESNECTERGWDHAAPACRQITCPTISHPRNGKIFCSKDNLYNSQCFVVCDPGYHTPEGSQRAPVTCQLNGIWTSSIATCTRIKCRDINIRQGFFTCSDMSHFNSTCTFECKEGYNLLGSKQATCTSSGWDAQTPNCGRLTCSPPLARPSNGQIKCVTKGRPVCNFSCNTGYELIGASVSECQKDETWSVTDVPICQVVRCPKLPPEPRHGNMSCTKSTIFNSVCEFKCSTGYSLVGEQQTRCTEKRTWEHATPTCEKISCPKLVVPGNGLVACSDKFYYESKCSFSCDDGYKLVGRQQLECYHNSTWSKTPPYCKRITCSPSYSNPSNGKVDCSDANNFNSLCRFTCEKGFSLEGKDRADCESTGWTLVEAPTCKQITCPLDEKGLPNGSRGCDRFDLYASRCTYSCNHGYELVGAEHSDCTDKGTWSDATPKCTEIKCPEIPKPKNGLVLCGKKNMYDSECQFECDQGYVRAPDIVSVRCMANRRWKPAGFPICDTANLTSTTDQPPTTTLVATTKAKPTVSSTTTAATTKPPPPETTRAAPRDSGRNHTKQPPSNQISPSETQPKRMPTTAPVPPATPHPDDGPSSPVVVTRSEKDPAKQGGFPVVVVAAVAAVVVLVLVVLCVVFFCRRKAKKKTEYHNGPSSFKTARVDGYDHTELGPLIPNGNGEVSGKKHEPLSMDRLEMEYNRRHADDDKLFREEYHSLTDGSGSKEAGGQAKNKDKNRYTNILPYDHSRVILPKVGIDPNSDYINASFVDGYKHKGKFIAAQGPKTNTVDDFWRMIWEQNVSTIIMATNLEERNEQKCAMYWPDYEMQQQNGDLHVTNLGENHLVDYSIRSFSVRKVSVDATMSSKRNITQYHFTSWPDFGVPKSPSGILKFLRKIKHTSPTGYGPTVVHCSAGVGRTGTFICIDATMDMISRENKIDVFGFCSQMRQQRPEMVQTEQQYIFIYQAILEHQLYGDTEVEASEVSAHIEELMQRLPGNVTGMEHEFKKLTSIRIQKEQMRAGNHPANMRKNRVLLILPYDWNRVMLPIKRGQENTDYINASHIDGYRQKDAYIATQGPLPHTTEDFWRMVWHSECASIVVLTELVERGQAKCVHYWPNDEGAAATFGDVEVELLSTLDNEDYTERDFRVSNKTSNDRKQLIVKQFHYHGWPEVGAPVSGYSMIELVEAVQKQQQNSGNNPIVIHCSAGAGRTGAFCALSTALEQVKAEGVVDMFQIVKCLRMQRPHMVQNLEQYEFCYRAVQEYIDSMSEYYNFK